MFFERKETPLKDTNQSYPIRHRRRHTSRSGIKYGLIVAAIIMAMAAGSVFIFNSPLFRVEVAAPPPPEPTRVPFDQPISAPTSVPDVVVEPAYAVGIEFPAIGFYSSDLVLAPGQETAIVPWTEAQNNAFNGALTPIGNSIATDTTVPGGGMIGTNVHTSAVIAGHSSAYGVQNPGVFLPLMKANVGDPVTVISANGARICYAIADIDDKTPRAARLDVEVNGEIVSMSAVDAKYRYAAPIEGTIYVITCFRPEGSTSGPTTELRVMILQINQGAINAGSC